MESSTLKFFVVFKKTVFSRILLANSYQKKSLAVLTRVGQKNSQENNLLKDYQKLKVNGSINTIGYFLKLLLSHTFQMISKTFETKLNIKQSNTGQELLTLKVAC